MNNIKGVVIPAAGLGTRFLPFTKSIPKEMLPIINKPAIEYIVQEAILSGMQDFFVVTNKNKKAISDYFKSTEYLKSKIQDKQKLLLLEDLDKILSSSSFFYINQDEQNGLGHAILMAKEYIKDEFFCVMLPDDIIFSLYKTALGQLIEVAKSENASVIAVQEVPDEYVSSYGIIKVESEIQQNLYKIDSLVEKPTLDKAPSNLAIVGRYVLSKKIFDAIELVGKNSVGEIQLTDAIYQLIKEGHKVFAYKIQGTRYDIGTPAGWLNANIQVSQSNNFLNF